MIPIKVLAKLRTNPKPGSTYDILDHTKKPDQSYVENAKRILVPIDGQLQFLKATNGAVSLFKDVAKTRTFLLNVIECTDDEDESLDDEMTSTIEDAAGSRTRYQKGAENDI